MVKRGGKIKSNFRQTSPARSAQWKIFSRQWGRNRVHTRGENGYTLSLRRLARFWRARNARRVCRVFRFATWASLFHWSGPTEVSLFWICDFRKSRFFGITSRILRLLMEHIERVCSLESKLSFISICSVRILNILEVIARNADPYPCPYTNQ